MEESGSDDPVAPQEEENEDQPTPSSGPCGTNAVWSFDPDANVLTVSGSGEMADFSYYQNGEERPWDAFPVTSIVISEGITAIGAYAFCGMAVTAITIPGSVSRIDQNGLPEAVLIYGYTNSFAEQYAAENGFSFSSLGSLRIDLANCTASLSATQITYTGSAIKPDISIEYSGQPLVAGTDYSFRYQDNVLPGEASVIITAKGDVYTGSVTLTFEILALENAVTFEADSFSLTASAGEAQTVELKATAVAGNVTYTASDEKITVTEEGVVTVPANYAGTITVTARAEDPEGIYATAEAEAVITVSQIANTITTSASSFKKTASTKAQTFTLGTKRNGSGKITYKSSDTSIKVSSTGKVTVAKNYVGKATITITVAQRGIYKSATKKVRPSVPQSDTIRNENSHPSNSILSGRYQLTPPPPYKETTHERIPHQARPHHRPVYPSRFCILLRRHQDWHPPDRPVRHFR